MAKVKRTTHRETYVRLLTGDGVERADYVAAAELLAAKKANGWCNVAPGGKVVNDVVWEGPTMEGRLLADQLTRELYAESWWARVKRAALFAAGLATAEVFERVSGLMSGFLSVG